MFNVSLFSVSLHIWAATQVIDIYLWLDQDQLVVSNNSNSIGSKWVRVSVCQERWNISIHVVAKLDPGCTVHLLLAQVEKYSYLLLPVQLNDDNGAFRWVILHARSTIHIIVEVSHRQPSKSTVCNWIIFINFYLTPVSGANGISLEPGNGFLKYALSNFQCKILFCPGRLDNATSLLP